MLFPHPELFPIIHTPTIIFYHTFLSHPPIVYSCFYFILSLTTKPHVTIPISVTHVLPFHPHISKNHPKIPKIFKNSPQIPKTPKNHPKIPKKFKNGLKITTRAKRLSKFAKNVRTGSKLPNIVVRAHNIKNTLTFLPILGSP